MRKFDIKSYLRFIMVTVLIFAVCFGAGAGMASLFDWGAPTISAQETPPAAEPEPDKRVSILVLGSDERKGETFSRSDTIILVTIDPNLKKAAVISIPRDTRVTLPSGEVNKITAAYAYGGPEVSVKEMQTLMGITVDYYVELNFEGFAKVVDTLGGVSINVPQRMYKPSEGINLYPGLQRLDGKQALAFVRFRDYELGDIDRAAKQQQFLTALAAELLQPSTITKLPALINETRPYVDTNMGLGSMLKLSRCAPGFTAESVISQTLPGYFYNQLGADNQLLNSFWVADKTSVNGLVDKMLEGQTVAVIQEGPAAVQRTVPSNSSATVKSVSSGAAKTGTGNSIDQTSGKTSKSNSTITKTDSSNTKKNSSNTRSGSSDAKNSVSAPSTRNT